MTEQERQLLERLLQSTLSGIERKCYSHPAYRRFRVGSVHPDGNEKGCGEKITIESILGTAMEVEIEEITTFGPHKAVVPVVSGSSTFTGKNRFWFDPDDPIREGFIIR